MRGVGGRRTRGGVRALIGAPALGLWTVSDATHILWPKPLMCWCTSAGGSGWCCATSDMAFVRESIAATGRSELNVGLSSTGSAANFTMLIATWHMLHSAGKPSCGSRWKLPLGVTS